MILTTYVNGTLESSPVARRDIEKMDASSASLMPEKLLDALSEVEIRDLFAFLARKE